MMEFFINELSLNQQYSDHSKIKEALIEMMNLLQDISDIKTECRNLYNAELYSYTPCKSIRLDAYFKKYQDQNTLFSSRLQRINSKIWNSERYHLSQDNYLYQNISCTDTSIAEVAERSICLTNYSGSLLNFSNSIFSNNTAIAVQKNELPNKILISCINNKQDLISWLGTFGIVLPNTRIFEHHKQKHDKEKRRTVSKKGKLNSKLYCTDDEAQKLLDGAILDTNSASDRRLFNYDPQYKKYIIFNCHGFNKFHGYHMDDENNIPASILKHFNK